MNVSRGILVYFQASLNRCVARLAGSITADRHACRVRLCGIARCCGLIAEVVVLQGKSQVGVLQFADNAL